MNKEKITEILERNVHQVTGNLFDLWLRSIRHKCYYSKYFDLQICKDESARGTQFHLYGTRFETTEEFNERVKIALEKAMKERKRKDETLKKICEKFGISEEFVLTNMPELL